MKGDKKVLEHLQKALTMELAAVRQYMLHSHVLADWGLDKLASKMKAEMHEELARKIEAWQSGEGTERKG